MKRRSRKSAESDANKFRNLMNSIHGTVFMEDRRRMLMEQLPYEEDPDEAQEIAEEIRAIESMLRSEANAGEMEAEVLAEPLALPEGETVERETAAASEAQILNPHIIDALVSSRLQSIEAEPEAEKTSFFGKRKYGKPGRPPRLDKKPRPAPGGKRGRPATGKRSSVDWYGRTFYIRKRTDRVLEDALWKLKRSGIDMDKSELADALLEHWAEVMLGDREDFPIGDIIKQSQPPT
jgi:hypothetical protein